MKLLTSLTILMLTLMVGCTSEAPPSEPTPAKKPRREVSMRAAEPGEVPEVEADPTPVPDAFPPSRTSTGGSRTDAERAEVAGQKRAHARDQVIDWLRGLQILEADIDPEHVNLSSLKGRFGERALLPLRGNQAVVSMRFDGTSVSGKALGEILPTLPNLKVVSLRGCLQLQTGDMEWIFAERGWEKIDLTGCTGIDPDFSAKAQKNTRAKVLGP